MKRMNMTITMDNGERDSLVFDWDKAVKLIKENGIVNATAGLREDMFWTSGPILKDGSPVPRSETYTYLASNWATPVLVNDDTGEQFRCYRGTRGTQYNSGTYWPISALVALKDNLA